MNLHLAHNQVSRLQRQRANQALLWIAIMLFAFLCLVSGMQGAPLGDGEAKALSGTPQVWVEPPGVDFLAGTPFELRFHAGTPAEPVSRLFGLAFEVHYTKDEFIEFVQPVQAAEGDFLLPDVYTFTRHEPERKTLYLAVSRKRGAPGRSGEGVVLSLPIKIADDAPPDWEVCFEIRNVAANDSAGNVVPMRAGPTFCIKVVEPLIEVIPNPMTPNGDGQNDETEFRRDGGLPNHWVILIMDRAGRVIRRLTDGERFWDGRNESGQLMFPGVYLYLIKDNDRIVKRGLLGIIR